jgi:hypothetical protein
MGYGASRTLAPNRYRRNLLRLLDMEDIPDVRLVKSFGSFGRERRMYIESSCLANLASKFQCLALLKWLAKGDESGLVELDENVGQVSLSVTEPRGIWASMLIDSAKKESVYKVIIPKACD